MKLNRPLLAVLALLMVGCSGPYKVEVYLKDNRQFCYSDAFFNLGDSNLVIYKDSPTQRRIGWHLKSDVDYVRHIRGTCNESF